MDRDNTNSLFGIVKFSAIFIAMFQGKMIFDLRSENFKLNETLTQSKADAAKSISSAAKIEDDNLSQIEQVFTLRKKSTILPEDFNNYSIHKDRVESITQKIKFLYSTKDENIALKQEIDRLKSTKDKNIALKQEIDRLKKRKRYLTKNQTNTDPIEAPEYENSPN
jgi:hypothetical protein